MSRLSNTSKLIDENMDKYNIDQACKLAFEFFKGDFCDWYVEIAKTRIYNSNDKTDKITAQWILRHVLDYSLRLLHPFIPYVTEYIWQFVKVDGDTIMLSDFPTYDKALVEPEIEKNFAFMQEAINNIRNIRAEANVSPAKKIEILYNTKNDAEASILVNNLKILEKLANVEKIQRATNIPSLVGFRLVRNTEIYVPLADLIDKEKETEKIRHEIEKVEKELQRVNGKLNNENFTSKAPSAIIEKEKNIQKELNDKLVKLNQNLNKFLN